MAEPLTEAEFVNVTQREAFQRFGHKGRAHVLRLLGGMAGSVPEDVTATTAAGVTTVWPDGDPEPREDQ